MGLLEGEEGGGRSKGRQLSVQSVELLFDDLTEAAVRSRWAALAQTGVPAPSGNAGASNRPHVTLEVRGRIDRDLEPALAQAAGPLPLPVVLGGLLVFARRRSVLALAVVPSADLLAAQQRVHDALVGCEPLGRPGGAHHLDPGRWTPHVTLGRGLTAEQVGRAVHALGRVDELEGSFVALRRWDGAERRAWLVSSARPLEMRSGDDE